MNSGLNLNKFGGLKIVCRRIKKQKLGVFTLIKTDQKKVKPLTDFWSLDRITTAGKRIGVVFMFKLFFIKSKNWEMAEMERFELSNGFHH